MENIEDYLSLSVIDEIKEKIKQVDGNEIVFVGKTNTAKIVEQVNVIARGNQFSVPLIHEPIGKEEVLKLEIDNVCESLSPGGVVSKFLKNYEHRP